MTSAVWSEIGSYGIVASILAIMGGLGLFLAIWYTRETPADSTSAKSDTRVILLCAIAGAGLGWVFGIIVSPRNSSEQALFGKYEALVGGFISGFLSSKLTTLFNDLQDKGAFTNRAALSKMLTFGAAFLVITAATFNVRQYAVTGVSVTAQDGKTMVAPGETVQLFASARDPIDTAVVWSLDPATIAECPPVAVASTQTGTAVPTAANCPTISEAGLFTAPKTRTEPGIVGVLATNRRDRTKVGRIALTIGKEAAAVAGSSGTDAGGAAEAKPVKTPGTQ